MKNAAFIAGILIHLLIAQWAFYQAALANDRDEACGAHWEKIGECDNVHTGQHDLWMAAAWLEGAIFIFIVGLMLKVHSLAWLVSGLFVLSTYNNLADHLWFDPHNANLSEWTSLVLYCSFSLIILTRAILLWYRKRRIF